MYPSIIRSRNLCYSTIVLDDRYGDLPGIEYYDITTDQGHFKFAQGVTAPLPALLEERSRLMARLRERAEENSAGGGCTPLGLWGSDGGLAA